MSQAQGKLEQSDIFPYDHKLYLDICFPKIVDEPEVYSHHVIFEQFYDKLEINSDFQFDEIEKSFNNHLQLIQNYVTELQEYQDLVSKNNIKVNTELFFRKRLQTLGSYLEDKIGQFAKSLFIDESKKQKKLELNHASQGRVHDKFEEFYRGKFEKIMKGSDRDQYFIFQGKEYAQNEIEANKFGYFVRELCNLNKTIPGVVEYFIQDAANNQVIGETISAGVSIDMKEFVQNFLELEFNECLDEADNISKIWVLILKKLFDNGRHPEQGEDLARHIIENPLVLKNTPPSFFNDFEESFYAPDVTRDMYITDFPHQKAYFDLDNFGHIYKISNAHYSPQWMEWLDDLPDLVQNQFIPADKAHLGPEEREDFAKKIRKLIYYLYNGARKDELSWPEPEEGFEEDVDIQEVPHILLKLFNFLKDTPDFQIEAEEKELPSDFPVIEIQENIDPIVPILHKQRKPGKIDEDDFEDIFNTVEKIGGKLKIKVFLDNYEEDDDFNGLPTIKKKDRAIQQFTEVDLEDFELDEDPSDEELKNIKEDPQTPKPQILISKIPTKKFIKKPNGKKLQGAIRGMHDIYNNEKDPEKKKKFFDEFALKITDKIDSVDNPTNRIFVHVLFDVIEGENEKKPTKKGDDSPFVKQLKGSINLKIYNILKEKAAVGVGIISLLSWRAGDRDFKDFFMNADASFLGGALTEVERKQMEKEAKKMSTIDVALMISMLGDMQQEDQWRMQNITNMLERFGIKVKGNLQKYMKKITDKLLASNYMVKNFHALNYFFDFLHFFHMFDKIEVERKSREPKENSKLMSDPERKIYGNLFFEIYEFVMKQRLYVKNEYVEPINYTQSQLNNCLVQSYQREKVTVEDIMTSDCPKDFRIYETMALFLQYYEANQDQDVGHFMNGEILGLTGQSFYVETTPFLVFLKHIPESYINISHICDKDDSDQFCLEYNIATDLRKELDEGSNFDRINSILENYPTVAEKKYVMWNVLEYLNRIDNYHYEQLFKQYLDHQEHQSVQTFVKFLEFEDGEEWVVPFLRLNYAHYNQKSQSLANAVYQVYDNGKLEEMLFDVENITYNGMTENFRVFHYYNVAQFLMYSHSSENYGQLKNFLKTKAWLILLIKREINQQHHNSYDMDEELRKKAQNSEEPLWKLFKEILQSKYPKIEDNKLINEEDSDALEDFLGLESEEGSENYEDIPVSTSHNLNQVQKQIGNFDMYGEEDELDIEDIGLHGTTRTKNQSPEEISITGLEYTGDIQAYLSELEKAINEDNHEEFFKKLQESKIDATVQEELKELAEKLKKTKANGGKVKIGAEIDNKRRII